MKTIAVTGSAGQIAYSLLFRLAAGELYGPDEEIQLHLIDLPDQMRALEGLVMELEDCAFPLLKAIHIGSNCQELFTGADFIFLLGAKPRGPGMERRDLLLENAGIFAQQGRALQKAGCSHARVLVVGNPCNTNAWVLSHFAPDIAKTNIHAMTRLDQNRARCQLAKKSHVSLSEVSSPIIWGNHSNTQVPDFTHTTIRGRPCTEMLDRKWLENDFIKLIQDRGSAVIQVRGKSSAASAASSALDAALDLVCPTEPGKFYSSATYTSTNPYGIDPDLFFSMPCRTLDNLEVEVVRGFVWDRFMEQKIRQTEQELIGERQQVISWLANHSLGE